MILVMRAQSEGTHPDADRTRFFSSGACGVELLMAMDKHRLVFSTIGDVVHQHLLDERYSCRMCELVGVQPCGLPGVGSTAIRHALRGQARPRERVQASDIQSLVVSAACAP